MMKACVSMALLAGLAAGASAQTSPLYLSDYSNNVCWTIQGGAYSSSFRFADGAIQTLVVDSTIRTVGSSGGQGGRQYDLAGSGLGPTYTNPGVSSLYDATTDGTNYNYFIPYTGGTLYRTNLDWTGLTPMYSVPSSGGNLGTAYDTTDNTIWISDGYAGAIYHYDLGGGHLGTISTTSGGEFALALDPADGVLYARHDGFDPYLYMYSKSGASLGTMDVSAIGIGNVVGMDFAPVGVPAPASVALLGLGGLAAARRRR